MVESIITYLLFSSYSNTWNILSQISDLAQRVKRLWTLFQLPYPGAGLSTGRRCATPTEPALVETGDAVDEGPVILGRNADPAGTPRQETLHPVPLSGAQLVTLHANPSTALHLPSYTLTPCGQFLPDCFNQMSPKCRFALN